MLPFTMSEQDAMQDTKPCSEVEAEQKGWRLLKELRKEHYHPLFHSTGYCNTNVCIQLIKEGADINLQDEFGMSALMLAAKEHHIDVVAFLLHYDARTDIKNRDGKTAQDIAEADGYIYIANKIIQKSFADAAKSGTKKSRKIIRKPGPLLTNKL